MKLIQAIVNNSRRLNQKGAPWHGRAEEMQRLIQRALPSGSGFDNGTTIDSVSDTRVVLRTSFHHMDEHGFYDGWSEHTVVVTSSFTFGMNVRVTGRDRNGIKDFIAEEFERALGNEIDWS